MASERNQANIDTLVLGAIDRALGQVTFGDLVAETGLPASRVKRHLRTLVRRGRVYTERGTGGVQWYGARVVR